MELQDKDSGENSTTALSRLTIVVSSRKAKTNMTRMSAVVTFWMSLTKEQTTTRITNSSDE